MTVPSDRVLEAAFQNLHAAEAEIALLYDPGELRAELPEALARVEEGLQKDDPRRADAQRVATSTDPPDPHAVSRIIEIGYSAADQSHTRVRNFRNVVVMAAAMLTIFLVAFVAYVATHPRSVPLCFRSTDHADDGAGGDAIDARGRDRGHLSDLGRRSSARVAARPAVTFSSSGCSV